MQSFARLTTLIILLLLGFVSIVQAATTVKILETWPPGDQVALPKNQHFYLRLAYNTDTPAHIWARPYFHGKEVNAGSNPSLTYEGSGETYGWFFLMEPGEEVDEIRITAGPGGTNTPTVATWHGHITGESSEATSSQPAPPEWIASNAKRIKAANDLEHEKQMAEPVKAEDIALFNGFMLAMFGLCAIGLGGPIWAMTRWHGYWRMAAAVPAAIECFFILRIVIDTARDATSHNLWPFEIIIVSLACSIGIFILFLVKKFSDKKENV